MLVLVPVRRSGLHPSRSGKPSFRAGIHLMKPSLEKEKPWRTPEGLGSFWSLFLPLDADALKNIWTWRGRIPLW